jgi:hypothetical protein
MSDPMQKKLKAKSVGYKIGVARIRAITVKLRFGVPTGIQFLSSNPLAANLSKM